MQTPGDSEKVDQINVSGNLPLTGKYKIHIYRKRYVLDHNEHVGDRKPLENDINRRLWHLLVASENDNICDVCEGAENADLGLWYEINGPKLCPDHNS